MATVRDYQVQILHPGKIKEHKTPSGARISQVRRGVLLWVGASVYPSNGSPLLSAGFY